MNSPTRWPSLAAGTSPKSRRNMFDTRAATTNTWEAADFERTLTGQDWSGIERLIPQSV